MTDTAPVATEFTRLIAAAMQEHDLVSAVARKFPDITTAVLSAALQGATAAVERKINNKH